MSVCIHHTMQRSRGVARQRCAGCVADQMRSHDGGEVRSGGERIAAARVVVDVWIERGRNLEPVGEGESVHQTLRGSLLSILRRVRLGGRYQGHRGSEAQCHAAHQQQATEGHHSQQRSERGGGADKGPREASRGDASGRGGGATQGRGRWARVVRVWSTASCVCAARPCDVREGRGGGDEGMDPRSLALSAALLLCSCGRTGGACYATGNKTPTARQKDARRTPGTSNKATRSEPKGSIGCYSSGSTCVRDARSRALSRAFRRSGRRVAGCSANKKKKKKKKLS
jgi:hypothetical protein